MKKIIIIFICIFFLKTVSAKEITNDAEIKYKWYQEEISEGVYHPKSEKLPQYIEDENNIQYGEYSEWDSKYCDYSKENYLIEEKNITTYERVAKTKYVKIIFLETYGKYCEDCVKDIQFYHKKEYVQHKILEQNEEYMYLELPEEYDPSEIFFYLKIEHKFKVILMKSITPEEITLTYTTAAREIFIPTKSWIHFKAVYTKETTEDEFIADDFVRNVKVQKVCRVKEIKTYRYKLNKKYYDNNYHSYIENYIPDINDYVVVYNSDINMDTIEITKVVENTKYQKEYVYIEKTQEELKVEPTETKEIEKIVYKTKYIDKIKNKIPKKIYLLLIILILTIIILIIKLLKKRVD